MNSWVAWKERPLPHCTMLSEALRGLGAGMRVGVRLCFLTPTLMTHLHHPLKSYQQATLAPAGTPAHLKLIVCPRAHNTKQLTTRTIETVCTVMHQDLIEGSARVQINIVQLYSLVH